MIKGFAGTAIELQDFDPAGLELRPLLERQAKMECTQLSVDVILDSINFDRLTNVAVGQFLQALVHFVPSLSHYQKNVDQFYSAHVEISPINPSRCTNIIPLATNSADEMTPQGLKRGITDFLQTQMGITEDTLKGRVVIVSGDGKTFDMTHRTKKYVSMHTGDYESWRFIIPLLELWHTKWTDLSRTIRASFGADYPLDPSTLNRLASVAGILAPKDLKKVDFNTGSHLVDLALDAHLLVAWE